MPDNGFSTGQASRGEFIAPSKEGRQSHCPAMVSGVGIAFWGFRKTRESCAMQTGHSGEEFFGAEGRGECVRPYGHAGEQERHARGYGGAHARPPARHACRGQREEPPGQGGDRERATSDTGVRERETHLGQDQARRKETTTPRRRLGRSSGTAPGNRPKDGR